MTTNIQINTNLWNEFTALAQQKRKRPDHLLEKLVTDYLAIQKDLQLDESMRQQAVSSGHKESDAVTLVKQYRQRRQHK